MNAQLALICYQQHLGTRHFALAALNVLSVRSGKVSELSAFIDLELVRSFGFPETPP